MWKCVLVLPCNLQVFAEVWNLFVLCLSSKFLQVLFTSICVKDVPLFFENGFMHQFIISFNFCSSLVSSRLDIRYNFFYCCHLITVSAHDISISTLFRLLWLFPYSSLGGDFWLIFLILAIFTVHLFCFLSFISILPFFFGIIHQ